MAKIMLVEDDNNLREIYEARLLAEGHEIISAHDGEEALALAVREKPELIISDVMMPKISGFDMLDILRSSPETKDTKVIMMTALSQLEDKDRADRLGADRYLVKSQVTLEDVIRVATEVLNGSTDTTDQINNATEPVAPIGGGNTMPPMTPAPNNNSQPDPSAQPAADMPTATPPEDIQAADPATANPVSDSQNPTTADMPVVDTQTSDTVAPVTPAPYTVQDSTLTPESAPELPAAAPESAIPTSEVNEQINTAQTANAELNEVEQQIDSFINSNPTGDPVAPLDPEAPSTGTQPSLAEPAVAPEPAPEAPVIPDGFVNEPAAPNTTTPEATPPTESASNSEIPAQAPEPGDPSVPNSSTDRKSIQPLGDPTATPDLNALAAQEAEKEAAGQTLDNAAAAPLTPPAESQAPNQPAAEQKPDDPNSIAL